MLFTPASPVTNCQSFLDCSPLKREVLYGRPLTAALDNIAD